MLHPNKIFFRKQKKKKKKKKKKKLAFFNWSHISENYISLCCHQNSFVLTRK